MKLVHSLFAITLAVALIGCDSSEPPAVDASAPNSSAGEHDHDHGHDHDHDHDHDEKGHDHDESDHPESFSEAVEQIKAMGNSITDAFASGKPDDAHDELHEIGHVIECLPELAKTASLSSAEQATVLEVTEALMDAFGELDDSLHGGEAVKVDDISTRVSTQTEKLQPML